MNTSEYPPGRKSKKSKGCLIGIITIGVILVGSVGLMAVLHLCPPLGPWPMPPWCGSESAGNNIQSTVEDYLKKNTNLGDIANSILPEQDPKFISAIPKALPSGEKAPLVFEIALPPTSGEVALQYKGQFYPMERQNDYYYSLSGLEATTGDTFTFSLTNADRSTSELQAVFNGDPIRAAANWPDTDGIQKPGFMRGHAVMDAGSNIPIITRTGSIAPTLDAMLADGSQWFAYDYYWAYKDKAAPEIINEASYDPSAASDETLVKMIQMVHERGLHYLLLTELEWVITPEQREEAGCCDSIDEWMAFDSKVWSEGSTFVNEMGEKLQANPDDMEVQAYWDRWFEQFGAYILHAAQIAEDNQVAALALGKQLVGAMVPENDARWKALIADVRKVYHGQLTQALWTNQYSDWSQMPWLGDLDFLTIYDYSAISDADHPTLDELTASFEKLNRAQYDALYKKFGKPLVFLNPFQSRDHAARQDWFEPMASCPADISQDWLAQADMYEAFFQAASDEPWFGGMLTWGYWVTPNFPAEYCFQMSSTVRGKPAELVIQRWFNLIQE